MSNDEPLLVHELRVNAFGVHLYSVGDDQWRVTLIDWQLKPPADPIVYDSIPQSFESVILAAYRQARTRRSVWIQ